MNKDNEIWYDINGYEGIYAIITIGRAKSLRREIKSGRAAAGKTIISDKIFSIQYNTPGVYSVNFQAHNTCGWGNSATWNNAITCSPKPL